MAEKPFGKILIANRGEIAVRIIRACHELGIEAVSVFSEADTTALHVQLADEAICIGPAPSTESYLRIDKIIEAAKSTGADAIHPGYGFLSERASFAEACADAGIVFIGPSADAMRRMGDKLSAREVANERGVPIAAGSDGALDSAEKAEEVAEKIGYPVILKASAGGGGKGMRLVRDPADLLSSFRMASSEAGAAFGDPTVYVEKYIENPRHIEIQIMADSHGNVVHLGERECSIQRRHQKLIEESPSAVVDDELREKIGSSAVEVARGCGYVNAGTVEFMLDSGGNFYFLEMNARLQVEHPVTELITGIDLVHEQIRVAAGEKLSFAQKDIRRQGSAIELRLYAEDADNNFAPSPGTIKHLLWPGGPGVRIDSGVYAGYSVPLDYDPLLAKLIVWAEDRPRAIKRMRRALRELRVGGVITSAAFADRILAHPSFIKGDYDTHFLNSHRDELKPENTYDSTIAAAVGSGILENGNNNGSSPVDGGEKMNRWRLLGRMNRLLGG